MRLKRVIYEMISDQGTVNLINYTKGASDCTPVLFIHGMGSSAGIWFKYPDSFGSKLLKLNEMKQEYSIWSLQFCQAYNGDIIKLAHQDLWASLELISEESGGLKTNIVAHSMGGIVARYFSSKKISHPYSSSFISKTIEKINLLAVPNHGTKSTISEKLRKRITRLINSTHRGSSTHDFGIAWLQLLEQSDLMNELNEGGNCLNADLSWTNAIAIYDKVVPQWSAKFEDDELPPNIDFKQAYFAADHMTYPVVSGLVTGIKNIIKEIPDFAKALDGFAYPAIHRSSEVFEWLFSTS
ncbi:MAG: esterase/lipase family protein [Candidatus Hodarchaeales archaeon]